MDQEQHLFPINIAEREKELGLIQLLKVLRRYKWYIFLVSVAFALVAVNYISSYPSTYKATVVVATTPKNEGVASVPAGLMSFMPNSLPQASQSSNFPLVRIKTRHFLYPFINNHDLKPVLFASLWDNKKKKWIDKEPSDEQAFNVLKSLLMIKRHGGLEKGLISLSVKMENPADLEKISYIANSLVDGLNTYLKREKITNIQNSIIYLERELETTALSNSRLILYKIIEEKTKSIMLENSSNDLTFMIIEPAMVPSSMEPKPTFVFVLLAAGLGLLLGGLTSVAIYYSRNLVKAISNGPN